MLRKHLVEKVAQLTPIKLNGDKGIFEVRVDRKPINENVDEATIQIPKLTLANVTAEYDKYAKALRVLDTRIQQANWSNELDFNESEFLPEADTSEPTDTPDNATDPAAS